MFAHEVLADAVHPKISYEVDAAAPDGGEVELDDTATVVDLSRARAAAYDARHDTLWEERRSYSAFEARRRLGWLTQRRPWRKPKRPWVRLAFTPASTILQHKKLRSPRGTCIAAV